MQQALAEQIRAANLDNTLATPLQIAHLLVWNPTPPCLDIYPSEEYQLQESFGVANTVIFLEVRGRVNMPDHDGAQELLLSLMDPTAETSVQQAINADPTLGGEAEQAVVVAGPSNFGFFPSPDPSSANGFTGCTWTVRVAL